MGVVTRPILAAAIAAVCCARTAAAASSPVPSPCPRVVDVPITIYNRSHMTGSELDAIVETAGRLWQPYRVTLAAKPTNGVAVIVSDGSTERDPTAARKVLGTTMFSNGHAVPYIHLWIGAAEALLDGGGSPDVWSMPANERDSLLLPILGVALAHELGHLLLDTSGHARDGMLQRAIPFHDLQRPTAARLGLNGEQQLVLCASKENYTPDLSR